MSVDFPSEKILTTRVWHLTFPFGIFQEQLLTLQRISLAESTVINHGLR